MLSLKLTSLIWVLINRYGMIRLELAYCTECMLSRLEFKGQARSLNVFSRPLAQCLKLHATTTSSCECGYARLHPVASVV